MDPTPDTISQPAIEAAVRSLLGEALTDPMKVEKLARIWKWNRNKMLSVLRETPCAVQHGSTWQVPVFKMPHSWLIDQGILPRSKHDAA